MLTVSPETKESFTEKYITSSEIMDYLCISRAGFLYGRRSGKIKAAPIIINDGRLLIWERKLVEEDLHVWKTALNVKAGNVKRFVA